ncbi:MAG: BPSS1780 family membrane protein, partial [Propionivibrio sp.]
ASEIVLAGQVALTLFLPVMMAYWFAPVLVAWHNVSAGKALFFSFVACVRNWRAFLVYVLAVVLVGALLPGLIVGVLGTLFAGGASVVSVALTVLITLVLLPTLYASFYISYRDVFVASPTLRSIHADA